jgi:hypothetical protein
MLSLEGPRRISHPPLHCANIVKGHQSNPVRSVVYGLFPYFSTRKCPVSPVESESFSLFPKQRRVYPLSRSVPPYCVTSLLPLVQSTVTLLHLQTLYFHRHPSQFPRHPGGGGTEATHYSTTHCSLPTTHSLRWSRLTRLSPPPIVPSRTPTFRGLLPQSAGTRPLPISTAMRSSLTFTAPQHIEQLLSTGCDPWPKEVLESF